MKCIITAALLGLAPAAFAARTVTCEVSKTSLASDAVGQPRALTLDLSVVSDEGQGAVADLGEVGAVKVNLNVYLTDKSAGDYTMQFDEQTGAGASAVLASTRLNREGVTTLTFRAPGGDDVVAAICLPPADAK